MTWFDFDEAKKMKAYIAFHEKRFQDGDPCYMIAVTNPKAYEFLKSRGFTHCMEVNPKDIS